MRRLIYIYIIIYILIFPLVSSFSPSNIYPIQRKYIYMYVCVYTSDYILFIISDHEEKGKSMRNSDYMRVYFPSSVVHLHTHPSYSFSALVSYSNDCNLKYFSLYRMREDWNLKKFMTRCILISATFHNSQISEKVLHLMQNLFPTK